MRANETAYRRIYEDLRDKIVAGDWPAGARLPSKRQTAADYGVSVITAEHAYSLLCDEGYAEARERSGTYAAYRPKDRFPVGGTRGTPPPPQPHASGDFPYSVYAKAVRRVLADYEGILYEKSPAGGLPLLRRTLADYLARSRGIRTDPENILIGSGSEYCYTLIPMILGRDRIYAVESPSY
ncbi:MAG: GntR family transcriptional regulator, partial [Clostridia bacterium]|nr:GntR family transcriptional regulator [Clostridia bacterium]